MDSGTIFVEGLLAHAEGLKDLAKVAGDLISSEIYSQRLVRCLKHPRNDAALGDFLALDNIFRVAYRLCGGKEAGDLRNLRERVFEEFQSRTMKSAKLERQLEGVRKRMERLYDQLRVRFDEVETAGDVRLAIAKAPNSLLLGR